MSDYSNGQWFDKLESEFVLFQFDNYLRRRGKCFLASLVIQFNKRDRIVVWWFPFILNSQSSIHGSPPPTPSLAKHLPFFYSGKRHGKGEGLIFPVPGSNHSAAEQGFYIGGWKHNMRCSLFEDTSPPNDNNNNINIYYTACLRVLVITISKAAFVRDSFRVIQH